MSLAEQRYQPVLAVIKDGRIISEVAIHGPLDRRSVHRSLARYEAAGLEGLADRSHKAARRPHQTSDAVETAVLELGASAGTN